MVVLVGGPAAGKTTWAKANLDRHRFATVSADDVKEQLPEYSATDPSAVHKESTQVAKRMMLRCIDEGRSFIYDGTGTNVGHVRRLIDHAHAAGFSVAIHYVRTPVEVALRRLQGRERKVPEAIVREKHAEVEAAYRELAPLVEFAAVHDNSKDIAIAKAYNPAEARGNRTPGPPTIQAVVIPVLEESEEAEEEA